MSSDHVTAETPANATTLAGDFDQLNGTMTVSTSDESATGNPYSVRSSTLSCNYH